MSAFCSLSSPILQDLFKGFARHLSHLLTEEQNPARKSGELAAGESTKVLGSFDAKWIDVFRGGRCRKYHLKGGASSLAVKEEAQRLIKEFFKTRVRCESETDWQELQSSES